MGNFASTAFRSTAAPFELPSDAVVIDCDWLEATHAHFKDTNAFQFVRADELKTSTSLTSFLSKSVPRVATNPLWVRDAIRLCRLTLRALITKPTPAPVAVSTTVAPITVHDLIISEEEPIEDEDEHFFDEFHQVFEPHAILKKKAPVPAFVVPSGTVVKTVGKWKNYAVLSKMKSFYGDEEDEDDYDDFEDCASFTTDATDSLSESESEDKCFGFCDLECEHQEGDDNDDAPEDNEVMYSDDEDNENDGCEARAERLLRIASTCSDVSIFLDDYLCTCGECPQYKLIAYEVQRYGTYADEKEKKSLTRILQAFSTYNEVVGYDCDMIPTAEECLQVWDGDEDRAFKSFAILYDEVPHLCSA